MNISSPVRIEASPAIGQRTHRPQSIWGVTLGAREIGFALLTDGHLIRRGVMNIRKLASSEAKQARFRRELRRICDAVPNVQVAALSAAPAMSADPPVQALEGWLDEETTSRSVPLTGYERMRVKAHVVGPDRDANHRNVSVTLAARHPELRPHLVDPDANFGVRTAKERYWQPMFLALGAVWMRVHELGQSTASDSQEGGHR